MLCNCNHVKYWQPELLHNSYKGLKLSLISCFWASKCHEQTTNSRLHQIRAGSGGWDSDKRHVFMIRGWNLDHSQTVATRVGSWLTWFTSKLFLLHFCVRWKIIDKCVLCIISVHVVSNITAKNILNLTSGISIEWNSF